MFSGWQERAAGSRKMIRRARGRTLSSVAFAWDSGSKLVNSDNPFAVSKIITSAGHLATPMVNSPLRITAHSRKPCFYGWQTVLTSGNHTDTEITSALWLYCHSYFSSTRLPDKPLHRYADSANYFKISGRQFKFQLKIVFCSDLRGCIATGLRSRSLKVWMHYLTRNLIIFYPETGQYACWDHPRCDRSVPGVSGNTFNVIIERAPIWA